MPLYPYECRTGHRFDLLRPMAERDAPASCAHCGTSAARALAAPRLAVLSATQRRAHARNERSAHEPRRVSRAETSSAPAHVHATTCASGHAPGRPWMLGH